MTKCKTDWSAVGRRSRRKGKSYERVIACMLREWTCLNWQTTRNSGRTDLVGDVYCLDESERVVIECKDREDFQPMAILMGTIKYLDEIRKVEREFGARAAPDRTLLVFARVAVIGRHLLYINGPVLRGWWIGGVEDVDGRKWNLLPKGGLDSDECRKLLF